MLQCITACGNSKDPNDSDNTGNAGSKDTVMSSTDNKNDELTFVNAEVKLVYSEENYLLLAYHGSQSRIGMHYCASDGTDLARPQPQFWNFDKGWRLVVTNELPENVDASSVALSITDYSKDDKPTRVFFDFPTAMSVEELKEIGVCFFNGHAGNVSSYGSVYRKMITIAFEFNWWGVDRNIRVDKWPFTTDSWEFFTSDGTPLNEAYQDYKMSIETKNIGGGQIWVNLEGDREATNNDYKKLVALNPYAIFTADDGSTIRIELLVRDRKK